MMAAGKTLLLTTIVLLVLAAGAAGAPVRAGDGDMLGGKVLNDFKACGGASACLGAGRLERVRRRSGLTHTSTADLAKQLETDRDMGVDLKHERLIFTCKGLSVTPEVQAAASASLAASEASLAAQAAASATSTIDFPDGAAPALAAQPLEAEPLHHHHHHHHRRNLLGTSNAELACPVAPETVDPTSISEAEVFNLHSRPAAIKKIYLNFRGAVVQNTAWNYGAPAQITVPPYSADTNTAAFSATELSNMYAIWRGVAEDYAFADVDVTTQDPASTGTANQNFVTALIGGSSTPFCGSGGCGGIAYVGVWGRTDKYYQPALVFPNDLGSGNPKNVWEATSHEIGHNLGLSHDGDSTTGRDYYTGASGGNWAPIMGVGYYKTITQWSKGEYTGANQKEDDVAIIGSKLGFVTEVHGASIGTATPLTDATFDAVNLVATAKAYGVMRAPDDFDVFSFTASRAGNARLELVVMAPWGSAGRTNLNMSMTLFNATGSALITRAGLGIPAFTVALPSNGTYYVQLSGTGVGSPLTTGYSSYGSRGQFSLVATYPSNNGTAPPPSSPPPASPPPATSPPPASPPPASPPPTGTPVTFWSSGPLTITVTRGTSTSRCKATVTIVSIQGGTTYRIGGLTVAGTWTSVKTATGWPVGGSSVTAITSTQNSRFGQASFAGPASLPNTAGNGCTFVVNSVSGGGYVLDPALTLAQRTVTRTW